MKRICVFAGSNLGAHPKYQLHARELGQVIAANGWELVYGGSKSGLMGEVANAVLDAGGTVIGVMPTGLFRGEVVHTGLSQLIEVKDMHERKATMGNLSDAFVALPGGYGTFEELFEVVSWAQLGIHHKPIGLLNVADYYVPLMDLVHHAVQAGFVRKASEQLLVLGNDAQDLMEKLKAYRSPIAKPLWQASSTSDLSH
ncbi:MAG: TIGR00730 family Rossman fold protein [Alicyclobacillus herbarius]|uniref:LOG family protein n=1 Tax=Alicyclobacillus herbarius TaxID=122960 RepID=UPI0003FF7B9D|nr:TIGR00730 family Rossman fold protein [Alicyclobacillus herbarius]MCL6631898.1 TIGR00730 family Rossman fold protein [Alicyclobacillus herbarius]